MTENSSMAGLSWRSAFLAFCVTLLVCSLEVHAGLCYACSYTYEGDGTKNYKCVSDPASHALSSIIQCNFPFSQCTVRTVYFYSGFKKIQSVVRSCTKMGSPFHCSNDPPPTCQTQCTTDKCNSDDGDIGKIFRPSDTGIVNPKTSVNYPLIGGIAAGVFALITLITTIVICIKKCRGD